MRKDTDCIMELKPLKIGELVAKVPIVLGGMGIGVTLSGLAGAVASCGGVGIMSTAQIGYREPDYDENPIEANLRAIGTELKKARKISPTGILGFNIMVATKYYEEYVKAAVKAGADLIVSGAGIPTTLPEAVRNTKTKIAPIVSSLKSANVICKYWDKKYQCAPDLVVIEGPRAGGHLGFSVEQLEQIETLNFKEEIKAIIQLVKGYAVKYQKEIPVVAAGGIYDKQDMEQYLELGVDGVQMSTRFVTTYECDADEKYKQAYIDSKAEDIVIVKSPVGMPGRAINNKFMKEGKPKINRCHQCIKGCNPKEIPYCITDALLNAVKGNLDEALIFCGDNAYRSDKIESVKDIFQELCN